VRVERPAGVIACDRPIVQDGVLGGLLRDTPLDAVPGQLATLFALCGGAHRLTATNALRAARGETCSAEEEQHERLLLQGLSMREHALRLGLDLPLQAQLGSVPVDPAWLRGLPAVHQGRALEIEQRLGELVAFFEARLWGMPAERWCARFDSAAALATLAAERAGEVGPWAWLQRAGQLGAALPVELHRLPIPESGPALAALGVALGTQPQFCARPTYQGLACETGPWSRLDGSAADSSSDVWQLIASRVRELARLCAGQHVLRHGALQLSRHEALAYTEMARGVVLHWVKLQSRPDGTQAVADYRVLAPTEWNFHPRGALARAMRESEPEGEALRLLVQAFDPCVSVELIGLPALSPSALDQ
jgi:hypothetical protein